MKSRYAVSIATAVLLATPAHVAVAQEGQCSGVQGAAFNEKIGVARVETGVKRLNFVRSTEDGRKECPVASEACRDDAYVVGRDVVLTMLPPYRAHVCATYVNKSGRETSGWLPATALVAVKAQPVGDKDWVGTWRRTEAEIKIKRSKSGGLELDAEAARAMESASHRAL